MLGLSELPKLITKQQRYDHIDPLLLKLGIFVARFFTLSLLLAIVAGCTSTAAPGIPSATASYTSECTIPENEAELAEEVVELVNEIRQAEGLQPLVLSLALTDVASEFACEMIEEDFFAHINPETDESPGDRLTVSGYIYFSMGENLAGGQTTAQEVVDAWMNSEPHKDNILTPEWREIGVAIRNGGSFGWYWVQEFADPVPIDS